MKIEESVSLAPYTTFRIGGEARFFVEPATIDDLAGAVRFAKEKDLPILVLGEGSNMLIPDSGFAGLVIRPRIVGVALDENGLLVAGAGEHWDDIVAFSVARNFSGLENLSYIPGTVGAAPVQNIGAYGSEIKNTLAWVEVFDTHTEAARKLTAAECGFGYRESFFKSDAGKKFIITCVAFQLSKDAQPNISYKDLANYFVGKAMPTIAEVRDAVISIRKAKLPDVAEVGTAGSFFKNPIISEEKYQSLLAEFPGLPSFPAEGSQRKIPLAWILDKALGLNGFREGNVGLYKTQPIAIVNFGGATYLEVKKIAEKITMMVQEKIGINVEWEVNEVKNISEK